MTLSKHTLGSSEKHGAMLSLTSFGMFEVTSIYFFPQNRKIEFTSQLKNGFVQWNQRVFTQVFNAFS